MSLLSSYTLRDCSRVLLLLLFVLLLQDGQNIQPLPNDQELDAELDSLRRKLHSVRHKTVLLSCDDDTFVGALN